MKRKYCVKKDSPFGAIESVKTVSDLNSPVTGTITEVNSRLTDKLDVLQNDPTKRKYARNNGINWNVEPQFSYARDIGRCSL